MSKKIAIDTSVKIDSPDHARHGQTGTVIDHEGDNHRVKFDDGNDDLFAQMFLQALMSDANNVNGDDDEDDGDDEDSIDAGDIAFSDDDADGDDARS